MSCIINTNPKEFTKLSANSDLSRVVLAVKANMFQEKNDTSEIPTLSQLKITGTETDNSNVSKLAENVLDGIVPAKGINALTEAHLMSVLESNHITNSKGDILVNNDIAYSKLTTVNAAINSSMRIPQDLFNLSMNGDMSRVTINKHALNGIVRRYDRTYIHDRYLHISDAKSALKALKSDSSLSAGQKKLIESFEFIIKDTSKIPITFNNTIDSKGKYDTNDKSITLNIDKYDAGTILHEIAHALGVEALAANTDAAIHFEKIFDELKARTGDEYIESMEGITDYQEFFAKLANDAALINELENTEASKLWQAGNIESVYRAIMNFIRKILGLTQSHTNAYAESIKAGMASLEYDLRYGSKPRHTLLSEYLDMTTFEKLQDEASPNLRTNHFTNTAFSIGDIKNALKHQGFKVVTKENKDGSDTITATGGEFRFMGQIINAMKVNMANAMEVEFDTDNVKITMHPLNEGIGKAAYLAKTTDSVSLGEFVNSLDDSSRAIQLIRKMANTEILSDINVIFKSEGEMKKSFDVSPIDIDINSKYRLGSISRVMYLEENELGLPKTLHIDKTTATSDSVLAGYIQALVESRSSTMHRAPIKKFMDDYLGWTAYPVNDREFLTKIFSDVSLNMEMRGKRGTKDDTSMYDEMITAMAETLKNITGVAISEKELGGILNITPVEVTGKDLYTENVSIKETAERPFKYEVLVGKLQAKMLDAGVKIDTGLFDKLDNVAKALIIDTLSGNKTINKTTAKFIADVIRNTSDSTLAKDDNLEEYVLARYGFSELRYEYQVPLNAAIDKVLRGFRPIQSLDYRREAGLEDKGVVSWITKDAKKNLRDEINSVTHSERELQNLATNLERMLASKVALYKNLGKKYKDTAKSEENSLEEYLSYINTGQYAEAISRYIVTAQKDAQAKHRIMDNMRESLVGGKLKTTAEFNDKAGNLNQIKTFLDENSPYIDAIVSAIENNHDEFEDADDLLAYLNSFNSHLSQMRHDFGELSKDITAAAIVPFAMMSGYNGDIRAELDSTADISSYRKFLNSMAESTNDILSATDYATKMFLENARLSLITFKRDMMVAHQELVDATGETSTEWLYEKDEKGNPTGNFISIYNKGRIDAELAEYEKKNKGKLSTAELESQLSALRATLRTKHLSKEFAAMKSNKAQKKFYDFIISSNKMLNKTSENKRREDIEAPMVSRSASDLLGDIMKGKRGGIGSYVSGMFANKVDDVGIHPMSVLDGSNKKQYKQFIKPIKMKIGGEGESVTNRLLDASGIPIKNIPVHFVTKIEDLKDLSMDVVQSMTLLAGSVFNSHELNKFINIAELTDTIVGEYTDISKRDSFGNKIVSSFTVLGKKYSRDIKTGGESNIKGRHRAYLDMIYYGQMRNPGKDFKIPGTEITLNWSKLADNLGLYNAVSNLALNVFAGIQNPLNATANMRIEAAAGEFFNNKELTWAALEVAKLLPNSLGEELMDRRTRDNKLALWMEDKNTLQASSFEIAESNVTKKNPLLRHMKLNTLFILSSSGEYMVQARMSLALAKATKVLDSKGKEISYWDAHEVRDHKLHLKKGITKLNGKPFTSEDARAWNIRQNQINNTLNGIYNETDKSMFQREAIGRLVMLYRKFMVPGFNRRWGVEYYNWAAGATIKGYHLDHKDILIRDFAIYKLNVKAMWNNLSESERRNIAKSWTEIGIYLGSSVALMLLAGLGDDRKLSYVEYMFLYQLYRFRSEMGFFMNPGETFTLAKSPSAAITTIDDVGELFGAIGKVLTGQADMGDTFDRGHNAGENKVWNKTRHVIFPISGTLEKALYPEEKIKFFAK